MTITIDISPDVEGRLAERAANSGLAVPEYVQQIVERSAAAPPRSHPAWGRRAGRSRLFMAQDAQEHKDTLATLAKPWMKIAPTSGASSASGFGQISLDNGLE